MPPLAGVPVAPSTGTRSLFMRQARNSPRILKRAPAGSTPDQKPSPLVEFQLGPVGRPNDACPPTSRDGATRLAFGASISDFGTGSFSGSGARSGPETGSATNDGRWVGRPGRFSENSSPSEAAG